MQIVNFLYVLILRHILIGQYTVFGQVIKGMEFVDKIKKGNDPNGSVENPDKIISLTEKIIK